MEHKKLNRLIALGVFLVPLTTYIISLAPTVVFWDVGEFCAAAFTLQVPHPPGAPLFLLIARLSSMIPLSADIAVRMHVLSALGAAVSCGLLYLIIVDLMVMWKGIPATTFERFSIYGSAVIGTLSMAFANTFWFNAVEAEVYGLSMTFVALIILLGLRWYERADKDSGDRYILLIAYVIGLSVGVHLLAVLTIFPLMIIFHFRQHNTKILPFTLSMFYGISTLIAALSILGYFLVEILKIETSMKKDLPNLIWISLITLGIFAFIAHVISKRLYDRASYIFGIASIVIFGIIYPGVVKVLPSLLDGEFGGTKSSIISLIPVALILGAIYGVYYSIQHKKRLMNVALLSFLFIVLGYSTYTMVYIRANAQPPMNENDPSTLKRLVSYLNREQYGDAPVFNRRWDTDPDKVRHHKNYTSDLDYMWQYQIKHMYLRYLGWNYIGSEGDFRDAGVDWKKYYMIPFLLGLIGVYYQWRRQPNISYTMIATFIIMGVILALYQNQQEPQPRERDYFYVGSFFVFSLWIAYGVLAIIDFIREKVKTEKAAQTAGYSVLALAFIFVPLKLLKTNYHQANRSGNYVAWDYSYNMLQSCEKDALLITNGDNDTFPLWYLQDVEGIRRDIRIVNLSLANTPWYIKQLKHQTPYGAKKVPISTSDIEIENIRPIQFEPRWMELPVDQNIIQQYYAEGNSETAILDTSVKNSGVIRFLMPNTMQFGNVKAIRAQDIIVYDIIFSSNWQRPIYFAMTLPDDGKIGLRDYMQLTGLTFKLVPFKSQSHWSNINEPILRQNLFSDIKQYSKEPQYGFLWRGLQDSTTYYDEDTRRLLTANYRNMFISYALYCANIKNQVQEASEILDRMDQVLPRRSVPMDYRVKYDIATFYNMSGNTARYREFLKEVAEEAKQIIGKSVTEQISQNNPYIILYYSYISLEMYKEAEELLDIIKSAYATQQGIDKIIEQLRIQIQLKRNASPAAAKGKDTLQETGNKTDIN